MIPYVITPLPLRREIPPGPNAAMPVDGYHIEMPIGSQVVGIGTVKESIAVLVLLQPKAVKVKHAVLVMPIGRVLELPIGVKPGALLGVFEGQLAILRAGEWPTSAVLK